MNVKCLLMILRIYSNTGLLVEGTTWVFSRVSVPDLLLYQLQLKETNILGNYIFYNYLTYVPALFSRLEFILLSSDPIIAQKPFLDMLPVHEGSYQFHP